MRPRTPAGPLSRVRISPAFSEFGRDGGRCQHMSAYRREGTRGLGAIEFIRGRDYDAEIIGPGGIPQSYSKLRYSERRTEMVKGDVGSTVVDWLFFFTAPDESGTRHPVEVLLSQLVKARLIETE